MSTPGLTSLSGNFAPQLGMSLAARTLGEVLVVLGAMLLVAGAGVVWVLVFRRSRRRTRLYHRHHHRATASAAPDDKQTAAPGGRRRRRQRAQRPRFPTLAETGGLPPVRHSPPPTDFPP